MRKGQGVKPKTLFEAMYGSAASPEVEGHFAILKQYRKSVFDLAVKKQLKVETRPTFMKRPVEEKEIEAQMQKMNKLKDQVIQSWERIAKQPELFISWPK